MCKLLCRYIWLNHMCLCSFIACCATWVLASAVGLIRPIWTQLTAVFVVFCMTQPQLDTECTHVAWASDRGCLIPSNAAKQLLNRCEAIIFVMKAFQAMYGFVNSAKAAKEIFETY